MLGKSSAFCVPTISSLQKPTLLFKEMALAHRLYTMFILHCHKSVQETELSVMDN